MPIKTLFSYQSRPSRAAAALRAECSGFSLLELLVVVAIIGILAGVLVLSIGTLGADRELQREAERLQTLIALLNEEAIMESRDYGILFSETGYRFYVYDHNTLSWLLPTEDRLLATRVLPAPLRLGLELEDREVRLIDDFEEIEFNEQPEPQGVIFATGETTPMTVSFFRDFTGGRFMLAIGFDGGTSLTSEGFGDG